ncbi:MAG TPA: HD domain-containing phosphohydrolase [Solirubrobacteraceae bacterium]|nr:HD domain-containing phosphohydrolase [Solirubrobacteraceae bacterium]
MRTRPTQINFVLALLFGGLGVLALHTLAGVGGARHGGILDGTVYGVLMGGAALTVLARGVLVKAQRAAWLTLGAGLVSWCLGDLYYAALVPQAQVARGALSPADGLYLAFYPCCYVALVLLMGAHLRELRIGMWLDGLIGGLAAAAVGAAMILPPVLTDAHGSTASVAVTLAYPIGDLLLLVFTIGALGMTGWRPGRVWLLICAAMLASGAADSAYLYLTATGGYSVGDWVQPLWPTSAILLATAAWTPWPRPRRRRVEDWRLVSVPSCSLLAALGVFVYGNLHHQLTAPALGLAIATVLAVCVHLMMTVRENIAMLAGSRRLALTDPLTGLGNRRQLMEDLHVACRRAAGGERWELVLYDLNGFKRYNDSFGHPAGDALLARLSEKLRAIVAPRGTAYRMGGDEFCVLFRNAGGPGDAALVQASVAALSESGPGFAIDASHGVVAIPPGGSEPAEVMQLADQRLYRCKDETREASAVQQLRDVLLQAFEERYPDLQEHQRGVGSLALTVGRRLGMSGEELDVLARAAELHDVGKIAIPDAILHKPGPLDAEEWRFMHRHTILGERILTAATALRPVARLVRSSHERFDGGGYPDGLRGEQIPLGARVIFVCDAFDAMTSDRTYSTARGAAEALQELRACAGTQFDPAVVAAFIETFDVAGPAEMDEIPAGRAGLSAQAALS